MVQIRTGRDVLAGFAVSDGVEETDESAGVADGLLEPHYGLGGPGAGVFGKVAVFCCAGLLVGLGDGEDEEEGVGGAGDEG